MGRQRRCARLAGSGWSADPGRSGAGSDVTLFGDGPDGNSNLGEATIWALQTGHIAAAYQVDDWWIVVTPHGDTVTVGGAHTTQLMED